MCRCGTPRFCGSQTRSRITTFRPPSAKRCVARTVAMRAASRSFCQRQTHVSAHSRAARRWIRQPSGPRCLCRRRWLQRPFSVSQGSRSAPGAVIEISTTGPWIAARFSDMLLRQSRAQRGPQRWQSRRLQVRSLPSLSTCGHSSFRPSTSHSKTSSSRSFVAAALTRAPARHRPARDPSTGPAHGRRRRSAVRCRF
jgi:hypothetical protein